MAKYRPRPTERAHQLPLPPQFLTHGNSCLKPGQPDNFVVTNAKVADYKRCSYESCWLNKDSQVLDVGCGVGTDALNLLKIVGGEGTGKVIGIDRSQGLLDEAVKLVQDNFPEAVQTNRATFVNGDVYQLPFGDGTFDASRTDRVLQHLEDPTAALKEMVPS